jgi:hypothetical protein
MMNVLFKIWELHVLIRSKLVLVILLQQHVKRKPRQPNMFVHLVVRDHVRIHTGVHPQAALSRLLLARRALWPAAPKDLAPLAVGWLARLRPSGSGSALRADAIAVAALARKAVHEGGEPAADAALMAAFAHLGSTADTPSPALALLVDDPAVRGLRLCTWRAAADSPAVVCRCSLCPSGSGRWRRACVPSCRRKWSPLR